MSPSFQRNLASVEVCTQHALLSKASVHAEKPLLRLMQLADLFLVPECVQQCAAALVPAVSHFNLSDPSTAAILRHSAIQDRLCGRLRTWHCPTLAAMNACAST